jgi:hypothetical protein
MSEIRWRKSSYSGGGENGECVEVALNAYGVGVRDTKDRQGGQLAVTADGWAAFVRGVKAE